LGRPAGLNREEADRAQVAVEIYEKRRAHAAIEGLFRARCPGSKAGYLVYHEMAVLQKACNSLALCESLR
jgi:hypothetical protein